MPGADEMAIVDLPSRWCYSAVGLERCARNRRSMALDPSTNGAVTTIAVQADGKILIGGEFTLLGANGTFVAVTRNHIARLNADGSLDSSFDPNASAFVRTIAVQSDRKILVGGDFTTLSANGGPAVVRNRIARLNSNGTIDTSFDPNADLIVESFAVQSDGKILVGGVFSTLSPNGGRHSHADHGAGASVGNIRRRKL